MPKKRLRSLPLPRIYEGLRFRELSARDLSYLRDSKLPDFALVSLKALSSISPIDLGDFALADRRILVIDKHTILYLRDGKSDYLYPNDGFLYAYSYEANLVAGHYKEKHREGMWWWEKRWESDHFLPEIKIGCTRRRDFQMRVAEQVLRPGTRTGHGQKQILLFVMYAPEIFKLEKLVHQDLINQGASLQSSIYVDMSPGKEWFEIKAGDAYKIASKYQCLLFEESESEEITSDMRDYSMNQLNFF